MRFQTLNKILFCFLLCIFCFGCSTAKKELPAILTSKEVMWTIPKGVAFKAIQKPAYTILTEFVVPDDDLKVLYAGSLLELEQEANKKAVKGARVAKNQGTILGIVGSIFTMLAGFFIKSKLKKG
jgi:hypothetical protein